MPNKKLHGEFVLPQKPASHISSNNEKTSVEKSASPLDHNGHTHQKMKFYSSFCYYPEGVVVQNQDIDEEVVLVLRRHFITNTPWVLLTILFILVPFFIGPITLSVLPFLNLSSLTQTFLLTSYYLSIVGYVLINFSIWYFNVGVVTNKRVIDVDLSGILYRNVAETEVESLADVSYTQSGSIRSFFNYGDVEVQTEALKAHFEFDRVPRPGEVVRIIGDLMQKEDSK